MQRHFTDHDIDWLTLLSHSPLTFCINYTHLRRLAPVVSDYCALGYVLYND